MNLLDKILYIKPTSSKMILLFIPQIYGLWLLALGKNLLKKQDKTDTIYTALASLTVFMFIIASILPIILWYFGFSLYPDENGTKPILGFTLACWLITNAMLSKITVSYECKLKEDKYYNVISQIDYIRRFVELFFWPYYIWSLQQIVHNKYLNEVNSYR